MNIIPIMSFNPLLSEDTLSLILNWIQRYHSPNDSLITQLCLHSTCKFFQSETTIDRNHIKNFFQVLTFSSIHNQEIFRWFYNPSEYNNIWTFCYSCSRNELTANEQRIMPQKTRFVSWFRLKDANIHSDLRGDQISSINDVCSAPH